MTLSIVFDLKNGRFQYNLSMLITMSALCLNPVQNAFNQECAKTSLPYTKQNNVRDHFIFKHTQLPAITGQTW